jgi:hypothetical protein
MAVLDAATSRGAVLHAVGASRERYRLGAPGLRYDWTIATRNGTVVTGG